MSEVILPACRAIPVNSHPEIGVGGVPTARKYHLTRDHVWLQNQLESLLEEAHMKLSSLVSDLLGLSARRMLKALAEGESNPAALAALADKQLRATPEQLCDALGACTDLKPLVPTAAEDGAGAVAIS